MEEEHQKGTRFYGLQIGRYYHEGVVETWNFPWIDYKFQLIKIQNDENETFTCNCRVVNKMNFKNKYII